MLQSLYISSDPTKYTLIISSDSNEKGPAREAYHDEPEIALGNGYSESKWVSEQILKKASESAPLRSTIVRCGQLTGGPSGSFNQHEWFPSIVKSSVKLHKLPDTIGVSLAALFTACNLSNIYIQSVSWITGYDAADALLDMIHADDEPVLHLTSPEPVPWSKVIHAFAQELNLPVVPYEEWLCDLQKVHEKLNGGTLNPTEVESALQDNPALRLTGFFDAAAATVSKEDIEPLGVPKLDVTRALKASPSLRNAEQVGYKHVRRWVQYWRKTGFLSR